MVVGRGRVKGQFQSSLKGAIPQKGSVAMNNLWKNCFSREKPGQSKQTQQPLTPMPVLEAVLIPRDDKLECFWEGGSIHR